VSDGGEQPCYVDPVPQSGERPGVAERKAVNCSTCGSKIVSNAQKAVLNWALPTINGLI
jgi:hypothetical protein